MDGIKNWLRQAGMKLVQWTRHFMAGRCGPDKLSMAILWAGVLISLLSIVLPQPLNLIPHIVSYGLMFLAIYRCLSRNTYKRYQENRKFLLLLDRVKDREHRYFECPKCRQSVRVPRKKGKIAITCPKCKEKFIRKT